MASRPSPTLSTDLQTTPNSDVEFTQKLTNNQNDILLDFNLDDDWLKDDPIINNNNNTKDDKHVKSDKDEDYSDTFFRFKQLVKNRRKSTFCTIFSCGYLILTIILLLAPLTSKLMDDWKLYNYSIHAHCTITNNTKYIYITKYNNNNNNSNNLCYIEYKSIDGHPFTPKCGNKMHEIAPCDNINNINNNMDKDKCECYFLDQDKCAGTMTNISELQRHNNTFVVLLCIGSFFAIITIMSSIYSIVLIRSSGIYCSIRSIQNDDDKVFNLMRKVQENKKKRKNKRKNKRKHKKKRKKTKRRRRKNAIEDFGSILSSQFGSSTINSLHSSINPGQVLNTV